MPARTYPQTNVQQGEPRRSGWIDVAVAAAIFGLLWLVVSLGGDMRVRFDELHQPPLSLDVRMIPYYTARTVLRMFIAFAASLLFTFGYGYVAAKSPAARRVMLPIIDILQSVPVLTFLAITVTGFLALFPGSLLGVECACIFAVFTAQAWNMTFGFYHSMVTIPSELQEAASVYRLNRWQRFGTVELPSSVIGLTWNSMMSFGGSWFFVTQNEAITVLNKNIKLPGMGSYMASAVEAGDTRAAVYAIIAMVTTIVLIDQLLWRPVVAWAEKFKLEQTEAVDKQNSWVLDLLQRSRLLSWLSDHVWGPVGQVLEHSLSRTADVSELVATQSPRTVRQATRILGWVLLAAGIFWLVWGAFGLAREIKTDMTGPEMLRVLWLGCLTLLRVFAMTVLATLIWTPIGVWIGSKPRVAAVAQPLAQIAASFPVNMTFPFVVAFFLFAHISINLGSVFLIALGHAVVHPLQRHRRRDGDSHRSERGRGHLRLASLEAVENAHHPGDLSLLGDGRGDGRGRRVEREHRGRGGELGKRQAGGGRPRGLHRAGDRERRQTSRLLRHGGHGRVRGRNQPAALATTLRPGRTPLQTCLTLQENLSHACPTNEQRPGDSGPRADGLAGCTVPTECRSSNCSTSRSPLPPATAQR